ncbi:unnamed protein product, partial [Laminaria digitata]
DSKIIAGETRRIIPWASLGSQRKHLSVKNINGIASWGSRSVEEPRHSKHVGAQKRFPLPSVAIPFRGTERIMPTRGSNFASLSAPPTLRVFPPVQIYANF